MTSITNVTITFRRGSDEGRERFKWTNLTISMNEDRDVSSPRAGNLYRCPINDKESRGTINSGIAAVLCFLVEARRATRPVDQVKSKTHFEHVAPWTEALDGTRLNPSADGQWQARLMGYIQDAEEGGTNRRTVVSQLIRATRKAPFSARLHLLPPKDIHVTLDGNVANDNELKLLSLWLRESYLMQYFFKAGLSLTSERTSGELAGDVIDDKLAELTVAPPSFLAEQAASDKQAQTWNTLQWARPLKWLIVASGLAVVIVVVMIAQWAATSNPPAASIVSAVGGHPKTVSDSGWTDVLQFVSPSSHRIRGEWAREGPMVIAEFGEFSRIAIPCIPHGDYELRVEFDFLEDKSEIDLMCPIDERNFCTVYFGGPKCACGIWEAEGREIDQQNQFAWKPKPDRYSALVQVTSNNGKRRIQVELDGHPQIDWRFDSSQLQTNYQWFLPIPSLGLGSHHGTVRFHRAEIRMLADGELRTRMEFEPAENLQLNRELDLLAGIEIATHSVSGVWFKDGAGVAVNHHDHSRIMIPVVADGSYELTSTFSWDANAEDVVFILPLGPANDCMFFLKAGEWGIDTVIEPGSGEAKRSELKTLRRAHDSREDYAIHLWVDPQGTSSENPTVKVKLTGPSGNQDDRWILSIQDVHLRNDWVLPTRAFGLGAHNGRVVFRSLKLFCKSDTVRSLKTSYGKLMP